MKRIGPDITDEAKTILDRLCAERQQGMGAVISHLIMQSVGLAGVEQQMAHNLEAIYAKLTALHTILQPPEEDALSEAPLTDAQRYGTDFTQPVAPLPQSPRRGVLQRLLYTKG